MEESFETSYAQDTMQCLSVLPVACKMQNSQVPTMSTYMLPYPTHHDDNGLNF